ncbi:MAG: hypothetical protein VX438_19500, partial [Planctomycetota bacterium]|nr:hypothetical protein [Planctomycetota bacterium]
MASSTNTRAQNPDKYDKYLDERITQTATQVKWVELLSFFLTVAIFVLGVLFLLCVLDAWVLELRVWMRWSALVLLTFGSLVYSLYRILPFCLHRVNPLYAAKRLEQGRPELKNSVINYLTTESNRTRTSDRLIRQKMSQKAAYDVANIPVDVTVDRSQMIVAGYVLSAIVAVFALYKMLSPKDPFQTISRVILPASDMMSPARVKIFDLSPGDDQKYFGETVIISAKIKGLTSQ